MAQMTPVCAKVSDEHPELMLAWCDRRLAAYAATHFSDLDESRRPEID